jgi:DNA-binding transcriptional LysR family regulator
MNWNSTSFDWNQARAFLATAEEGSLSAAARALGLTQPTLGRQVASLEETLGVLLFDRVGRSLVPTEAGLSLLEHVRAMGEAANRVSLAASGRSQAIAGHVCISASDVVAQYLLPPVIGELRRKAPEIEIELVASNAVSDLRRREADIAIRHIRPEEPDLIARLVRETTARLYAASSWLEENGRPKTADDLAEASFVGFGDIDRMVTHLKAGGLPVSRRNFMVNSESSVLSWELVRRGFGIGIMSEDVAGCTPDVECILPDLAAVPVPYWLATHRELHTSRRIRLVYDLLGEAFG